MIGRSNAAAPPLLRIVNLEIDLVRKRHRLQIVRGLSLEVRAGQKVAILGESGAGKSVTARAIAGLLDPRRFEARGEIWINGSNIVGFSERQHRSDVNGVALIFQDPTRTLNPTMRIGGQIAEAVRAIDKTATKQVGRDKAVELLRTVGIADPEQRYWAYPHQLSGGMRQRVVIAIALALAPTLLLADEATTSLDVTTQAQIMDLVQDLVTSRDMALVLITHDIALAASSVDEIYVMYAGRVVEHAPVGELISVPRMPYTKALLAAVPGMAGVGLPIAIPGQPLDLGVLGAGCPFHPRCGQAVDHCLVAEPELRIIEDGRSAACWVS